MSLPVLSPSAGLGLKPEHFRSALDARASGLWFEVHAENFMAAGGPRLAWLEAIRAQHPLSIHGIGLSLGGSDPVDKSHLSRLKVLVDRYQPALVSEHMAWSVLDGTYFPDLLPPLLNKTSLARFTGHIDQVQEALGRQILLENPSHYMPFRTDIPETEFLTEIAAQTGCGLLLDVNNVHVSANNLGFDAMDYLRDFPVEQVGEIHLAGFKADEALGDDLLIDTHNTPVSEPVWSLYQQTLTLTGRVPTLIERDSDIPAFDTLLDERDRAQSMLDALRPKAALNA
ncbi:MAG: DUF692 domain-containing protein [Maricaulis sp.]|jgi:uncharacterized protein (UPF0276 family)|nr:DUF692 domain-containing protein [Maricaulis sp.]MDG2045327.1 DUF692 domain-containing protein [Maricaulis sp.]